MVKYGFQKIALLLMTTLLCLVFMPASLEPIAAQSAQRDNANEDVVVVMVPPFENISGIKAMTTYETDVDAAKRENSRQVDRYAEGPRAILEDILFGMQSVEVVERQRLDAMLRESGITGLVDSETAIQIGKVLGANTIVMGSVVNVRTSTEETKAYGVQAKTTKVFASLRIRVIDIESGKLTFSQMIKGEKTYISSQFRGLENSDIAFEVIESILDKLRDDEKFEAAILASKYKSDRELFPLRIEPKADNCNISIDGLFQGLAPLTVELPPYKEINILIDCSEYQWGGKIIPSQVKTHQFSPALVPK